VSTEYVDSRYAAPSAQCDLIMKGGISSGIVYPRAAYHLATRYRFRRLGGASAGAIAAAAAAAAEHGRRGGGFIKLAQLPTGLGTHLADLFQPTPTNKPAFAMLSDWLEPDRSKPRKLGRAAVRAIRAAPLAFVAALAAMLIPAVAVLIGHGLPATAREWLGAVVAGVAWLPVAAVIAVAIAIAVFALRTMKELPRSGFGLCDGHTRDVSVDHPPLTDWVAATLDELAGLPRGVSPLTLGDLWGQNAVALAQSLAATKKPSFEQRLAAREAREVDLEVMTTNLTFRRPYRFPFSTRIFYFCEKRMRVFFPDYVVDHLVATSTEAVDDIDAGKPIRMVCTCHREQVRSLPDPWNLPVVMAARLSLSFPGLISAVPLFCVDWARGPGHRTLIETWFSDGGISSNFPMHFFDSLWPTRPTFGINLNPQHPDFDALVWTPNTQGARGILPRSHETTSMLEFLRAIFDTMQNWVDTTQITMPGFRDRVATVRQSKGEGGVNLKMKPEVIEGLAGEAAAALFDDFDFDLHRWIRYRVAMSELDDTLGELRHSYHDGTANFIEKLGPSAPRYQIGGQQAVLDDREATARLIGVADAWAAAGHPSSAGTVPRPKPAMRLTPRQ
jgi:predicted acylesterase/phospholipase RssA